MPLPNTAEATPVAFIDLGKDSELSPTYVAPTDAAGEAVGTLLPGRDYMQVRGGTHGLTVGSFVKVGDDRVVRLSTRRLKVAHQDRVELEHTYNVSARKRGVRQHGADPACMPPPPPHPRARR